MKKQIFIFLIADILLISLAVYLAFLLRFDGTIPAQYLEQGVLQKMIFLVLLFSLPIFYTFELYSFSWSHVSTNELISLAKAILLSFVFFAASFFILKTFKYFPRSTIFISYFLIFIFCGGIRFAKRIYLQIFKQRKRGQKKEKTLIVGAGDAGAEILRSILSSETNYLPLGFVDDNSAKQGIMIHGLKVLGKISDIPEVVKEKEVEQMIVALPSAGISAIKNALVIGRKAGLKKIKVVPPIAEIINGQVSIRNLRDIQIEDLLGREEVILNTQLIENFIQGKKILITGAAGSIGSELSRQVSKFRPRLLLLLDQDETGIFNISKELSSLRELSSLEIKSLVADVRDIHRINQVFRDFKPDIIFHAAAYKHVPLMEEQPDEAVKNNIFGTSVLAQAALSYGAERFIFISTDKSVNPTSVMGATKRIGEMICQALNKKNSTRFISVRFGNVLDSRGNVIQAFREQIKKGGPVEVTHPEMKRYIMVNSEAVLLVMQAAAMGWGGEVFVLDMGKPINILDLAKELIGLSGFEPDKDIPIVFTEPRPGEKFFEEILSAEEGTVSTKNQNIFMARLSEVDEQILNEELERLKIFVQQNSQEEIINSLKKLVPSYRKC